jgi:amidase
MNDYTEYDALGLAALVRSGEVTPAELAEQAIARIERDNPALNAVIHPLFEQARRQSREISTAGAPFHGVPFLVKDLLTTIAGAPYSKGCQALKQHRSPRDSELMKRYRAAGLVTLGKTNTPEFGLMGVTEPVAFGPTRNPWDRTRSPGGSSGGSAAAVAAGFVPMAGGGDGGGSIRIPAACCGLFGLKPSRGRTPTAPLGAIWQGAAQEHVLTRSVRDSAAMLDAVQGSAPGAPYVIAPPERPYLEELNTPPGRLRIAWSTESPLGESVDPACIAAVEQAVRLLGELGHQLEETRPEYDGRALAMSYMTMYFGEVAAELKELDQLLGRPARATDVEPLTWMFGLLGRATSAGEFVESMQLWNTLGRIMGGFFQCQDLYLTPTTATLPPLVGGDQPSLPERMLVRLTNALGAGRLLKASGLVEQIATTALARVPFTQLANLTGLPAMSVPLYWTEQGLPVGVHFMAPFGAEARLLQLAAQLEQAAPWFGRRPPAI